MVSSTFRAPSPLPLSPGERGRGEGAGDSRAGLMIAHSETTLVPPDAGPVESPSLETGNDRRADIDGKMTQVAALLEELGCAGLLLLDQDNLGWLTSGACARGVLDPRDLPGIYCNGDARWVLCANLDSQRLFDEELDGLGFQLKEWPYHWGR